MTSSESAQLEEPQPRWHFGQTPRSNWQIPESAGPIQGGGMGPVLNCSDLSWVHAHHLSGDDDKCQEGHSGDMELVCCTSDSPTKVGEFIWCGLHVLPWIDYKSKCHLGTHRHSGPGPPSGPHYQLLEANERTHSGVDVWMKPVAKALWMWFPCLPRHLPRGVWFLGGGWWSYHMPNER